MNDVVYYEILILMFILFAYAKGWIFANFKSISADEAVDLINKHENIAILDVRTKGEYKSGYVYDAISLPLGELSSNIKRLEKHKNKQILVYCQSGSRSVAASRILNKNGFCPLNIKGGIMALENCGAKIIK